MRPLSRVLCGESFFFVIQLSLAIPIAWLLISAVNADFDAICFERVSRRALQIGGGFVEFGLRAKFIAARGRQCRLLLQDKKDG